MPVWGYPMLLDRLRELLPSGWDSYRLADTYRLISPVGTRFSMSGVCLETLTPEAVVKEVARIESVLCEARRLHVPRANCRTQ